MDSLTTEDKYKKLLAKKAISVDDYSRLLNLFHDIMIAGDASTRSEILRAIRYGLISKEHCVEVLNSQIHELVIASFEKDSDVFERMQALKVIKKFISAYPDDFPLVFARSLVASAASENDSFRRVSLETLRELALANSTVVSQSTGFIVMVKAIIDPSIQDMSEVLLYTLLKLVSSPKSRFDLRVLLNQRILLSPFTDMDSNIENKDVYNRLLASKAAFIAIMKTWVGVFQFTSDPLGLTVLIRVLKDPKMSTVVREVVVDAIMELLSPLVSQNKLSKVERNKASRANQKKQGAAASRAGKSSASGDLNMGINVAAAPVVPSDHWSNIFGVTSNMRNSLSTSHRGASEYGAEALHHHSAGGGAANASGRFSVFFNKPNAVPDTIVETQGDSDDEERDSLVPSSMINKTLDAMNAVADVGVDGDFIYNLMDNYAAILTSALIHVGLVDALCHLGSYADSSLAVKCRTLLVDLLTVVCGIFPESTCAELLEIPHLVAYAATVSNSTSVVSRSLKASDILSKLAGSFSNSISGRISGNVANNTASLYSNPFISGSFSNVPSNTNSKTTVSYATGSKGNSAHAGEHAAASLNTKESVGSIAILMKSSCKPRVDGLLMSCRDSSAINDLMYDLRHAITAAIDKVEFNRQMEGSKVIGKEGKEPFKWNWALIDDMLEYSFKNPERLPEALRTKWVKRLSGFYRCTVDEKAYFANLDWESVNMIYLECACNMYHVLVGGDVGMTFLSGGDRRGMLFNEMSYELETLVGSTSKGWNGTHEAKNVFRMHNCSQTLAREYFTLLGRMSTTAPGRKLLDSTQVFQHLSMLGHQRSLDYVSRLALTALTFTDGGYFSRNLLQIFTTSGGCSSELRFYTHTLLRAMLRKSRDTEFVTWGIEMMVTQMLYFPTASLAKVLEEAAQDIQYLKALVSKKANFIGKPNTDAILLRYCALSDGIAFLQENEWLTKAMSHWEKTGILEYTTKTELSMAKALALCCKKMKNPEVTTPIPIAADVYHNATPNSTLESGVCVDLEGLLRIPWNIEVKLSTTPQQQPSVTANLSAWEYLKVDSFLDASSLVSTACGDVSSDHLRLVKVRGLVLDSTGLPCGHPIAASRIIASALLCGVSPVLRTGKVVNLSQHAPSKYAQAKEKRRVTLSQMKSDYDKLNKSSSASIRSSLSLGGDTHFVEPDLPVTFQFEPFQDWSFCKPQHRCGRVLELPNDRFSVEVPGEPVVFVFSRSAPKMLKRVATDSSMVSNTRRSLSKDDIETNNVRRNSGVRVQQPPGIVYLVEIHYYLRLKTNQDTFVPIPRHLYGELSRNSVGINILREHVVVKTLLRTLNDEDTVSAKRRSALWALGHIGATSAGYNMISREMPRFVKWIISIATTSLDYSLRATAFIVLGLVGRSHGGGIHLAAEKWGISPRIGVAVAIPKDLSSLFCMHINPNSTANTPLDSPCNPAPAPPLLMRYPSFKKHPDLTSFEYVHLLKPFMPRESVKVVKSTKTPVEPVECNAGESTLEKKSKKTKKNSLSGMFNKKLNIVEKEPVGTTTEETVTNTTANNVDEERDDCPFTRSEIDVLNAIAKLSGQVMYKDSLNFLKEMKKSHPEMFDNKILYQNVLQMLGSYAFKLNTRRLLRDMFSNKAKLKS